MEGFERPAGAGDFSDPLERAAQDIRERCHGAVRILWDDGRLPAPPDVHKLKVIARDLPLVFPVEHDVLVEGGKPYRAFVEAVARDVDKALRGRAEPPPTS